MSKQDILLISYSRFEKDFLEKLAGDITREFVCPVHIEAGYMDFNNYYDPERRQYDGNKLINVIDSVFSSCNSKKIGLFSVDLFIPIFTCIFGQAVFNGNTGIASLYRLRNEHYGMKKDENLLFDRFRKVIIHELGHTFGLIHCHMPTCVMRSCTYVEDLDQKSHHLCPKCRTKTEMS